MGSVGHCSGYHRGVSIKETEVGQGALTGSLSIIPFYEFFCLWIGVCFVVWLYTIVPMLSYLFLYVTAHAHFDDECQRAYVLTEIIANLLGIIGALSAIVILYYAHLWLL